VIEHQQRSAMTSTPLRRSFAMVPSVSAAAATSRPAVMMSESFSARAGRPAGLRRPCIRRGRHAVCRWRRDRPPPARCLVSASRWRGLSRVMTMSSSGWPPRLAASGVMPSMCSMAAAEVVPNAAQSALRSSCVGRAVARPLIRGTRSGEARPARYPIKSQAEASAPSGTSTETARRARRPLSRKAPASGARPVTAMHKSRKSGCFAVRAPSQASAYPRGRRRSGRQGFYPRAPVPAARPSPNRTRGCSASSRPRRRAMRLAKGGARR
jgi:hypothetical protein